MVCCCEFLGYMPLLTYLVKNVGSELRTSVRISSLKTRTMVADLAALMGNTSTHFEK